MRPPPWGAPGELDEQGRGTRVTATPFLGTPTRGPLPGTRVPGTPPGEPSRGPTSHAETPGTSSLGCPRGIG